MSCLFAFKLSIFLYMKWLNVKYDTILLVIFKSNLLKSMISNGFETIFSLLLFILRMFTIYCIISKCKKILSQKTKQLKTTTREKENYGKAKVFIRRYVWMSCFYITKWVLPLKLLQQHGNTIYDKIILIKRREAFNFKFPKK